MDIAREMQIEFFHWDYLDRINKEGWIGLLDCNRRQLHRL
jgi:hypothetical protein